MICTPHERKHRLQQAYEQTYNNIATMSSKLSDYTISVLYNHAVERGWKKTAKAILKETGKDADSLKEKLDLSEIFKAQLQAAQEKKEAAEA